MINEAAAALLTEKGLGVPGESLFIFHAPERVKSCILIIGDLDGIERDPYVPGYKKAEFKVIVRRPDYQSAMTIAKQVISALDLHRKTVNGIYINWMRAAYDPIPFPIPDSDVIEVAVVMTANYVEA